MVPRDELEGWNEGKARRRVLRWAIGIVAAAAALALLLRPAERAGEPPAAIGGTASPSDAFLGLELDRLEGGTLSGRDLLGSPVVLNFWASWCAPCREEAPLLQRTYETYQDDGLVVIGVNIRDTPEGARSFVRDFGITYPIVRDPDQELASALEVIGLPMTFFVAAGGRLVSSEAGDEISEQQGVVVLGAIGRDALIRRVEALLEDR